MKYIVAIVLFCCLGFTALAQTPVNSATAIFNGDTIPYYTLQVVDIVAFLPETATEDARKYLKLRRDVLKAYPYAKIASAELSYINETVATFKTEREKKKFIKEQEKVMKAQFEKDLRNLTYTQGKILIKLINRETGNTSYELVKELRGSLQAFFWQSIARLFTANLKSQYDPQGEDKMIEKIVQSIERGELQVRN
ncbi:MAG: DUF4294 domain-containing protein [Bacteroidetes bacterium]|nr:DUF4294 domain-containing protein [Bacteroidota bacterium]MCE7954540.1 DUF4294 domain-containing protein [Bacteroidetes bacterium CHB6]